MSKHFDFSAITDQNGHFFDPNGERSMSEWAEFLFTVTDIDSMENRLYETLDTRLYGADLTQPLQLKVKKVSDTQ